MKAGKRNTRTGRLIRWCPADLASDHPNRAAGFRIALVQGSKLTAGRTNRRGTLLLGLLLLAAGVVLILSPAGSRPTQWLVQLWPVFLICAGVVRVMGFAVERKPRSPLIGMLLIIIGVLFLAARFQPRLNALEVYGRYWVLLLIIFASVELVRYYSHRQTEGPPPRVLTPMRVLVVLLIVATGVLANRAANKPSVLSALRLPDFLSGLRDSVVGQTYAFTDQPLITDLKPGMKVLINNSYGSVKVTGGSSAVKATLAKGVRGWSEAEARKIADKIRLVINQTPDGLSITTNRDQFSQEFTTDIQVEVPSLAAVSLTDSYGSVLTSGVNGGVAAKVSHGQADIDAVRGGVNLELSYSDVNASNIQGNLVIKGAKRARVSKVSGGVQLSANNGSVELRDISGPVHVEAPFCRIVAQGLDQSAEFKTEHAGVDVTQAADVVIDAPHSDVRARSINGDLRVSSSNSSIHVNSISGELEVQAEQSSVNADDVHGAVDIQTTHGDVS